LVYLISSWLVLGEKSSERCMLIFNHTAPWWTI
jgi:hypothetical protein